LVALITNLILAEIPQPIVAQLRVALITQLMLLISQLN